uniref:Uncharacterized protein n=1 Tax=Oryctolagus cuniculus TaxID=9986 RepID=A0A5F9C3Q1_RABIT
MCGLHQHHPLTLKWVDSEGAGLLSPGRGHAVGSVHAVGRSPAPSCAGRPWQVARRGEPTSLPCSLPRCLLSSPSSLSPSPSCSQTPILASAEWGVRPGWTPSHWLTEDAPKWAEPCGSCVSVSSLVVAVSSSLVVAVSLCPASWWPCLPALWWPCLCVQPHGGRVFQPHGGRVSVSSLMASVSVSVQPHVGRVSSHMAAVSLCPASWWPCLCVQPHGGRVSVSSLVAAVSLCPATFALGSWLVLPSERGVSFPAVVASVLLSGQRGVDLCPIWGWLGLTWGLWAAAVRGPVSGWLSHSSRLWPRMPLTPSGVLAHTGDPCTVSSQMELGEAFRLAGQHRDDGLILHVFPSTPEQPGMPCPGEDRCIWESGWSPHPARLKTLS